LHFLALETLADAFLPSVRTPLGHSRDVAGGKDHKMAFMATGTGCNGGKAVDLPANTLWNRPESSAHIGFSPLCAPFFWRRFRHLRENAPLLLHSMGTFGSCAQQRRFSKSSRKGKEQLSDRPPCWPEPARARRRPRRPHRRRRCCYLTLFGCSPPPPRRRQRSGRQERVTRWQQPKARRPKAQLLA